MRSVFTSVLLCSGSGGVKVGYGFSILCCLGSFGKCFLVYFVVLLIIVRCYFIGISLIGLGWRFFHGGGGLSCV